MKIKACSSLALAAFLAAPALVHAVDRQAALDGLVAAEKAFSDTAAKKGIRDSFLDFMAEDGVLFRPDPVNAREYLQSRPATPGLLSWFPAYAEVSLSGDLGYDTGPAEYREKAGDKPEQLQFATVWKRQADGSWKALVDLGTQGNPPMPVAIALQGPALIEESSPLLVGCTIPPVRASLVLAEQALTGAIREKGSAAAYAAVLADDVRVLREGRALLSGKQAALDFLAQDTGPVSWAPEGAGISRVGDLGYTYGFVKHREDWEEGTWIKTGNYLRVWRRPPEGGPWKLAFEVVSPRPKPAPKPAEEKKP